VAASVGRPSASWLSMNEERRSRCPRRLRGKGIGPERMLKASASIAQKLDLALASLRASQLVLCVRLGDPETALAASEAALRGGIRCVEVTMTVPDAADVISTLIHRWPDAHIGAGTVLTVREADAALQGGAMFAMSPVVDPDMVRYCNEAGLLAVPGAATPSEVWLAAGPRGGARVVKLYPAELSGGIALVQALQGPLGRVPLVPTGGIALSALPAYFGAPNVCAVGVSKQILLPTAVARSDWAAVTARARAWSAAAKEDWMDTAGQGESEGGGDGSSWHVGLRSDDSWMNSERN
jgi:2-dehydro-3-deoxyphosphogluconate aldolase / (4S)-4-hydroxy-2-oxoglutarate aldolase